MAGTETAAVALKCGGLYRLKVYGERAMVTGHPDEAIVQQILDKKLANGIDVRDCGVQEKCEQCLKGKQSRKPFPKSTEKKSRAVLDLIHTDVYVPMETKSLSGFKYFLTITDDHSRYCVLYFLKNKSEVSEDIQKYVQFVKTQFNRITKVIR